MLTASVGRVGTAPATTTLVLRGVYGFGGHPSQPGLGAQCPPALLPINVAPDQSGGALPVMSRGEAFTLTPYGSEVEMKGLAGPFGFGWPTFLGILAGSLAVGAGVVYTMHKRKKA